MRLRSLLFAPGDSARKIEKAVASAADAVIIDLEDSVAASVKVATRPAVAAAVRAHRGRDIIVRVNPRSTEWYLGDLAAVIPAAPGTILLPKCTGAGDLRALDHHMEALETAAGLPVGSVKVIALVTETAPSLFTLGEYAGVAARLIALGFGAEDISGDLGVPPRRPDGGYPAPISAARAATLAAAAACGIVAIDTPWPDFKDPTGLRLDCANSAADGFVGKFLIHPDQIEITNIAFSPSPEQVAWARLVTEAFAKNPDAGVFALDGKMIDRPHFRLANRILDAAGLGAAGLS
jgi:citrate lyase subunit beta / citryl-CoA lyase